MNKSIAASGAIAIVTGIAAAVLWQQLRNEPPVKAQSQEPAQAAVLAEPLQQLPDVHITAPAAGKRGAVTKN
jgi:hypothetical protein